MKVTSEDVKALQERIDVTYEEAERLLLRTQGNMDKAVKLHEQKLDSLLNKVMTEGKRIMKELLTYYIKITRKDELIMNMPLIIIVAFFVILNVDLKIWIAVISIGIILISESTVAIYKKEKKEPSMVIRPVPKDAPTEAPKEAPKEAKGTKIHEESDESIQEDMSMGDALNDYNDDDDDDYYEITIEK